MDGVEEEPVEACEEVEILDEACEEVEVLDEVSGDLEKLEELLEEVVEG